MSLHQFPPLSAPLGEDSAPAVTLWAVGRALGLHFSEARLVDYVQQLVDGADFPPPFPSRLKGRPMTRAVTRHSTFRRDAVMAWLDNFLPPAGEMALDAAAQAAAAAEMDAAAASLGGLRLVQGGRA